jgi:Flp pilus assembly protein TadD
MIPVLLLAAASALQAPAAPAVSPTLLADTAHAIDAGRLEQARIMIASAVAHGLSGVPVDKLVADLAYASGKYDEALSQYQSFVTHGFGDPQICEKGAIAALKIGRVTDAQSLAECATAGTSSTWRAWNVRGVIADLNRDWPKADQSYAGALERAPDSAEVINNQGWSLVLRGDWSSALPYFQRAAALDPNSKRIVDNLELVQAGLSGALPSRRDGETGSDWAARLNDAGVAAELRGDSQRAVAAFTQALYASDRWYPRAANNLEASAKP